MTEPAYPAARAVAATVEEIFARHLAAACEQGGEDLAFPPDAAAVEAIVDTAFWASLRREEGRATRVSLAFLPPERAHGPMLFEARLPFTPGGLTRLSPAVERPGIHLGVWRDGGGLYVWGTTRTIPRLCFVLEVVEPGVLVVKYRRGDEFSKFANVVVFAGDQVKVVDEGGARLPDCPPLVTLLLGADAPGARADSVNVLLQLAVSMRTHGRGGSLLVVPGGSVRWRESIVSPVRYSVVPAFAELAKLTGQETEERRRSAWQEAFERAVESIGGLTAVDGAAVLSDRYELLAFGAKIGRPEGSPPVEQVVLTEPVLGSEPQVLHPTQLGGTRHLSAAQFAHDQRDAFALVASQDGRFTIFAWSPCEGMVHAHRVETLLL
jgi:hypothetical protein